MCYTVILDSKDRLNTADLPCDSLYSFDWGLFDEGEYSVSWTYTSEFLPTYEIPTDNLLMHYDFETVLPNQILNIATGVYDTVVEGIDLSANYNIMPYRGLGSFYKNSIGPNSPSGLISTFSEPWLSTQPLTICFWYKSLVLSPLYSPIFQCQFGTSLQYSTSFRINGYANNFVVQIGTGPNLSPLALPAGITNVNDTVNYYHICIVLTGTQLIYYINNQLAGTPQNYSSFVAGTYIKATIGTDWNDTDNNGVAKFQIDDFRFYKRVLLAGELTAIYTL